MTVAEILREWKLDADLVCLSACRTALGREAGGEGYLGFAQAFFAAGARSLLLSLWSVDDRATALLMQRFYQNLRLTSPAEERRTSKAEALREAKAWLRNYTDAFGRRPFSHPYFWSAFILIGDAD